MTHSVLPWVDPAAYGDVLHPTSDEDWDEFVRLYAEPDTPFANVLAVARESSCKSIVVEHRYIDLDFRSEHAAFWSLRFEVPSPFTRRLHFFTAEIDEEQLHNLPDDPGYLGYSILRPVRRGRVGRTVLAPPPRLKHATLSLIEDEVSMFGNDLVVRGVPFCEQDSEYLRCAHAAAWICHYVAVRRELVGRTSTSSLVNLIPNALSEERALPSKGMRPTSYRQSSGPLGSPHCSTVSRRSRTSAACPRSHRP